MIKYILYRDYLLKNLGEGNNVEVYSSTYSEAQDMYVASLESEVMAMFCVDREINGGRGGMITQADIDEMNKRVDVSALKAPEQEVRQWGTQPVVPKYPNYIMVKVRQHLGLEEEIP